MAATKIQKRKSQLVAAFTVVTEDYVVPNGETLYIDSLGGTAAYTTNVHVNIVWDPAGTNQEYFCTHGCVVQDQLDGLINFSGDGVKVLRIRLDNGDAVGHRLGGFWKGRVE